MFGSYQNHLKNKRGCQNEQDLEFIPATNACSRSEFFEKDILTHIFFCFMNTPALPCCPEGTHQSPHLLKERISVSINEQEAIFFFQMKSIEKKKLIFGSQRKLTQVFNKSRKGFIEKLNGR